MQRILFTILFSMLSHGALAKTYPPVSVEVKAARVSEHAYYIRGNSGAATEYEGFISNAGFVVTPEGVLVFDSLGSPSLASAFREAIRSVTSLPVKKVVVSHYHADHIYGLQVFKEEGAEIIAPIQSIDYLDSPTSKNLLEQRRFELNPWVDEDTYLVRPDVLLDSNTEFEFGGMTFRINQLGAAHSDGDISLFVVEDGVLFSGDIIFEGRIPYVGDADSRQWLKALESMETIGVKALVPGHGPAAENPQEALVQTREYLAYLRKEMGAAVDDFMEFAEAYDNTDWSVFENIPAFDAANRRNAYQVYLSIEREVMTGER